MRHHSICKESRHSGTFWLLWSSWNAPERLLFLQMLSGSPYGRDMSEKPNNTDKGIHELHGPTQPALSSPHGGTAPKFCHRSAGGWGSVEPLHDDNDAGCVPVWLSLQRDSGPRYLLQGPVCPLLLCRALCVHGHRSPLSAGSGPS